RDRASPPRLLTARNSHRRAFSFTRHPFDELTIHNVYLISTSDPELAHADPTHHNPVPSCVVIGVLGRIELYAGANRWRRRRAVVWSADGRRARHDTDRRLSRTLRSCRLVRCGRANPGWWRDRRAACRLRPGLER